MLLFLLRLSSRKEKSLFDTVKQVGKVRHANIQNVVQHFVVGEYAAWVVEKGIGSFSSFLRQARGFEEQDGMVLARQLLQAYVELKTYKIAFPYMFA